MCDPKKYPRLKLQAETEIGGRKGSVIIEPGCNCVLLGTRDPKTGRHGSYGSIDKTKIYDGLVEAGKLTDLRSFLPYRTYPKDSPPNTPPIPDSWERWLAACNAALGAFDVSMEEEPDAGLE